MKLGDYRMKFLDVFNEIEKGNYALTDESIYKSIENKGVFVPLYGGNNQHNHTNRKISINGKTKKGEPIRVFSGEGVIISLDGSAGSMTYKCNEQFALNHHAGFITLKPDSSRKVNLEYFAIYLQSFYRSLSVSDGSKTLSLNQIYLAEIDLPSYPTQCKIIKAIKAIKQKIDSLSRLEILINQILEKEYATTYKEYQGTNIPISECITYMSGNSGLTEECIYQTLQSSDDKYDVLSSATEDRTMMGKIPICLINNKPLKTFEGKEGLLVARNGKAGNTRYLPPGKYTINDHAYILYNKNNSKYKINLQWLAIQYKNHFLEYSSNSDNGTWNMSGFFKYTTIDIPSIDEQNKVVKLYSMLEKKKEIILGIIKEYTKLQNKVILNTN